MKHLLLTLLLFLPAAVIAAEKEEPQPSDIIKFTERVFDFGTIEEADGPVSHSFEFHNAGNKPVTILYARSGCVCVTAEAPRKPIAPGARSTIKVTYNPSYRPGDFSKEILIMNSDREYNRVWIKGTVNPMKHDVSENFPYEYGQGLWMNLSLMSFGRMADGEVKSMRLRMANNSDFLMRLSFEIDPETLSKEIKIDIPESFILRASADSEMKITASVLAPVAAPHTFRIYPVIDGKRLETPLEVKVFNKSY